MPYAKELAGAALAKDCRVYFFDRSGESHDISQLDPTAEHIDEAEWGGLVGFASKVNAGIAQAVNEADMKTRRSKKHGVAGTEGR